MINLLSSKAPSEVVPVTFDFAAVVASIDSADISIEVKKGADAGAAAMLFGAPQIAGTDVRQLVQAGLDQVIYRVRADIVSGDEQYSLAAYLPVVELA